MNDQHQPVQHFLSCKLKPISVLVFLICAQSSFAQDLNAANSIDAITGEPSKTTKPMDVPSVATQYGATKKTLLAADVKDTKQAGTGKTDSQGKPIDKPVEIELNAVNVRAKRFYQIGPLPGLALTKEEIPGNVQSISAKEIKDSHSLSLTDLMNSKLQSVNVNDYQSNPFQMDVTYRGFTASPQLGTAQGLSVFLDGVRVNEPFGDVVNWDMIPLNALVGIDVFPGSNPIFGLGTLGGAISMRTKSGFDSNEGSVEVLGGSFNRKQFQGSISGNNGVIAGFAAANIFNEDGWRDNSPSKVNQIFGKAEWRNERVQLGLSGLYAGNDLIGNGLLPSEVISTDPSSVFTSPDQTKNKLLQFQLTGLWDVSDTFNITGQVYKRKSNRKSSTSDINQDFAGYATRKPTPGEQIIPGYQDINGDGLPDYNLQTYNVAADANGFALDNNGNTQYIDDGTGTFIDNHVFDIDNLAIGTNFNSQANSNQATVTGADGVTPVLSWTYNPKLFDASYDSATSIVPGAFNAALPAEYYQHALLIFKNQTLYVAANVPVYGPVNPATGSQNSYDVTNGVIGQFTDSNGFFNGVAGLGYINLALVANPDGSFQIGRADPDNRLGKPFILFVKDANGNFVQRDGASPDANGVSGQGTGYVDGTANAVITKTEIDQTTDGGALQLNWNLEKHKFMMGASVDSASSTYQSGQYLGLLDANHRGDLSPDKLGYEYYAKDNPISLNDFSGNSITKSLYFSETWSPVTTFNVSAAARYNMTTIKNKLATNNIIGIRGANAFINSLNFSQLCLDKDANGTVDASECGTGINDFIVPFSPQSALGRGALGKGETEEFHYYSLNPSLGATWQVDTATNVYGNWSRGARTPSVIELGCAFDDTPVPYLYDANGNVLESRPRTLSERRFCNLPSTMSGDPYLKQVRSETFEAGGRGKVTEDIEWNASVYRTDLQDDIYFVAFRPERSFFTNIGNTRRQGLEMGVKGKVGKTSFGLNYALTDATFQSEFRMGSPNNSEAGTKETVGQCSTTNSSSKCYTVNDFQQIKVKPGNRMPGIPLHNINANVGYEVTQDWNVGLSMILHSSAFVRGNENNKHHKGPAKPIEGTCSRLINIGDQDGDGIDEFNTENYACSIARPDFDYGGKTAGYAVFNFNTSYKITKGLTAALVVNNIFDRQYASAGRLGINPFSPSIRGAIDPVSGFNYNSNDWKNTTFLAPGAPRAAWFSLSYDFDVGK